MKTYDTQAGEYREPTDQERDAARMRELENNRKMTICSCAMAIIQVNKITADSLDSPRAIARKAFDLAFAYWDELEARGLIVESHI